ncbi:TonB-dependent receptor [Luteimonas sp. XNQY3]|nr:TonB-dependent receptor [Luteimonas sp. XNQY3]MCD9004682.1 TonB-dependent receptor [Luteimonas sp. XNQY3]
MTSIPRPVPARLATAVALAVAALPSVSLLAQTRGDDAAVSTLDRIEVTGSRIKRADIEGALPVTVISRDDIEVSGKTTVADLLQGSTYNSFGSFTPSSGSSAQSFSGLSLRGLGAARTLILIDGRRAPKSPLTGEGQDLNSLPLAAVERIEILSDGASAIYGADAIGGVVNIITRKDFSGGEVNIGYGDSHYGGDTREASAILGVTGERGRLIAGVSTTERGITYLTDYPWSESGASTYSNNYLQVATTASGERTPGSYLYTDGSAVVPGGCSGTNFFTNAAGSLCYYDFSTAMADTASIDTKNAFFRGDYDLTDDWSLFFNAFVNKKDSKGVYAAVPESIFVAAGTPNNLTGQDAYIKHRFSALGNRYTYQNEDGHDVSLGLRGRFSDRIGGEFGIRSNLARVHETGYNYVNIPVAEQLFASGAYNALDPESNSEDVLDQIRTTTSRKMLYRQNELFGQLDFDLFELAGGTSALAVGAEYREEWYEDIYDQQSAAGNVGGSSGNSAIGSRTQSAAYAEWVLPVLSNFEVDLALRHDRYSDFGNSTSPKISLRWQPLDALTLRASYGEGFRAPDLPALNQETAFSAYSVSDPATALAYGLPASTSIQINGYSVATPDLQPETSKQFSVGAAWDATDWLNLTLDWYDTRIDNQIKWFSAQTVVDRTANGRYLPEHLYLVRNADGSLQAVYAGYGNEGQVDTDGLDFSLRTQFDLGRWGRVQNRLQANWVHSYEIGSPYGSDEYVGTDGYPEWRAALDNRWDIGDFSVNWKINAIGYEPAYYVDYYDGSYSCSELVADGYADRCGGAYVTHDLQVSYQAPWRGKISVGATNLTDRKPVYDAAYTEGFNDYLYNGYGRQLYLRYAQSF